MQKSQQVLPPARNFFTLTRTKKECYYPPVRVDFNSTPHPKAPSPSILPAFNSDRNFFTPTFLLPADQSYYLANSDAQRCKFAQKMQAEQPEPTKPCGDDIQPKFEVKEGDSRYCQICQIRFEDYWQHVAEHSHTRMVHLSPSTAHIRELCSVFASEQGNRRCEAFIEGEPSNTPRRRIRKKEGVEKKLRACRSSEMLNTLQGSLSTHFVANGSLMSSS